MNDFSIIIEGNSVSPTSVRLRDLFDVLQAFDSAIKAVVGVRLKLDESPELRLISVQSGSASYTLETTPAGYSAASKCLRAVESGNLSDLPETAQRAILQLRSKVKGQQWSLQFSSRNGMPSARIDGNTEFVIESVVSGATTLGAQLLRIGGTSPITAKLLLLNGTDITAEVAGRELAEELGKRLYKVLSLSGEAKWSGEEMRLSEFKITAIGDYLEDEDVLATLDSLSETSGGFWDDIDPDEYIGEMRSEAI